MSARKSTPDGVAFALMLEAGVQPQPVVAIHRFNFDVPQRTLRRRDPDRHRVAGRPVAPDRAEVSGHAPHRGRVNGDDQVTRTDPCARGGAVVGDPVDE